MYPTPTPRNPHYAISYPTRGVARTHSLLRVCLKFSDLQENARTLTASKFQASSDRNRFRSILDCNFLGPAAIHVLKKRKRREEGKEKKRQPGSSN